MFLQSNVSFIYEKKIKRTMEKLFFKKYDPARIQ